MNTLNEIADAVHANAKAKGFHPQNESIEHFMANQCNNLTGEVAELWEAWRAGKQHELCDKAEKMEQIGVMPLTCTEEELADVIIRALDLSASYAACVKPNKNMSEAKDQNQVTDTLKPWQCQKCGRYHHKAFPDEGCEECGGAAISKRLGLDREPETHKMKGDKPKKDVSEETKQARASAAREIVDELVAFAKCDAAPIKRVFLTEEEALKLQQWRDDEREAGGREPETSKTPESSTLASAMCSTPSREIYEAIERILTLGGVSCPSGWSLHDPEIRMKLDLAREELTRLIK